MICHAQFLSEGYGKRLNSTSPGRRGQGLAFAAIKY